VNAFAGSFITSLIMRLEYLHGTREVQRHSLIVACFFERSGYFLDPRYLDIPFGQFRNEDIRIQATLGQHFEHRLYSYTPSRSGLPSDLL